MYICTYVFFLHCAVISQMIEKQKIQKFPNYGNLIYQKIQFSQLKKINNTMFTCKIIVKTCKN